MKLINRKSSIRIIFFVFVLMNIIASFHAYKFTHFSENEINKTKSPEKLTAFEKVKTLCFGVNNPKPKGTIFPSQKFETIKLQSNKLIECWLIKAKNPIGTVILFHGYGTEKSSNIEKSDAFLKLGFNTILVDFMGSGNSEGNQTTIGFKEAVEVKTVFDYLKGKGEKNIYLFGTSMGAVAIMKAINDYKINPKAIILECPFGSIYNTTSARFKRIGVPTFPMAGLLLFWGSLENRFWSLSFNPSEYAKNIKCPTLLLYGREDKSVSFESTNEIFKNLRGQKKLTVFEKTGHENYLIKNKTQWNYEIKDFLNHKSLFMK
jgi:alpha-beta hydrolase superfamily lysophospholipase